MGIRTLTPGRGASPSQTILYSPQVAASGVPGNGWTGLTPANVATQNDGLFASYRVDSFINSASFYPWSYDPVNPAGSSMSVRTFMRFRATHAKTMTFQTQTGSSSSSTFITPATPGQWEIFNGPFVSCTPAQFFSPTFVSQLQPLNFAFGEGVDVDWIQFSALTQSLWFAPNAALIVNNSYSTYPADGPVPSAYLILDQMTGGGFPATEQIVGLMVELWAGLPDSYPADTVRTHEPVGRTAYAALAAQYAANPSAMAPADRDLFDNPGKYCPLEVSLSLDGSTPVGEPYYVFVGVGIASIQVGTLQTLWGRTWDYTEVDSPTLAILIRRPFMTGMANRQTAVDAAFLIVYHQPPGTYMQGIRETSREVVLLGAETTPGTLATTLRRMRALQYTHRPNFNMKRFRPQGEKLNAVVIPTREWSTGSVSGLLDYNEIPYAFEAIFGNGVHSGAAVAAQRNIHTYTLENRKKSSIKTYSMQRGDPDVRSQQALYLLHTALELAFNTTDCTVQGSYVARKFDDGVTLFAGSNEVQTITLTGTPTGGTFRLNFKGAETADLAYNIAAAALQTALQGLSTIGAGNATVTGTGPWVVTFASALAGQSLPPIRMSRNNLTGGTSPTVTTAETTPGGWAEHALEPIVPAHVNLYLANTYAGLTSGKISQASLAGLAIGDRVNPFWVLDRDLGGSFGGWTEPEPTFTGNLMIHANSNGMGYLADLRAGATRFLRIECQGPLIGATADYHKFIVETPFKFADGNDFNDDEGRVMMPWDLEFVEGPNGELPTVIIENGVVSY